MSARRFRKKPVVIEAMYFDGTVDSGIAVIDWLVDHGATVESHQFGIDIGTLEGQMRVSPGDWVIRGVAGEFYPVKPGIFGDTYEPVEEAVS